MDKGGKEGLELTMVPNGKSDSEMPTHLYKRRWLMVTLFSLYAVSNASQYLVYSIINNITTKFYQVDSFAMDWTSLIHMVVYIPFIFPVTWFLDKKGLRATALMANGLNVLGTWIKVGSGQQNFFWVALLGQGFSSLADVFIIGMPAKLASVWFGPQEVSTACSIGVFGTQLGITIGFLLPPILVPDSDDMEEVAHHIRNMFLIYAGIATGLCILVIALFQDQPELPPSQAQAQVRNMLQEDYSYVASIKRLLKNRDFMLLLITYGLNVGCLISTASQMIINHFPGEQGNAGRIGLTFVIAGMVGTLICGIVLDKTKSYNEATMGAYSLSLVVMLDHALTLGLGHLWLVFVTAGMLGFIMMGYLPLGFEFAAELTYPESEGTSSGLLNCSAQFFGIIFTLCSGVIIEKWGTLAGNMFLSLFLMAGTMMTSVINSDLRRQRANVQTEVVFVKHAGSDSSGQDYGAMSCCEAGKQQS